MPAILYGAPYLEEFSPTPESVLDVIAGWLDEMECAGLLTLSLQPGELGITGPTGATVVVKVVGDRLDMVRVLLGTRFSLRIYRSEGAWEIRDRHGTHKRLTAETFYGELTEMLRPQGPRIEK